jgi:hypothetical protein
MKPALVHLEPGQKARLAARARRSGNSFSQEVRQALDLYLDVPPQQLEELGILAREANRSADRMLAHLDEAIAAVSRALNRMGRK